jgi:hypothetical protein
VDGTTVLIVCVALVCGGALILVSLLYLSVLGMAARIKLGRFKTHDLSNLLGIAEMAHYRGDDAKLKMGHDMMRALLDPDDVHVVRLRRLVKCVTDLMEPPSGCGVDVHLETEIDVKVVPRQVLTLVQNICFNAIDALCRVRLDDRRPILVQLDDKQLLVRNVATSKSLAALAAGVGNSSKSGNGHGVGRRSALANAELLGWSIRWEVDGMYALVTVTGFVPAGEGDDGDE